MARIHSGRLKERARRRRAPGSAIDRAVAALSGAAGSGDGAVLDCGTAFNDGLNDSSFMKQASQNPLGDGISRPLAKVSGTKSHLYRQHGAPSGVGANHQRLVVRL
jgi:hypothetical protein